MWNIRNYFYFKWRKLVIPHLSFIRSEVVDKVKHFPDRTPDRVKIFSWDSKGSEKRIWLINMSAQKECFTLLIQWSYFVEYMGHKGHYVSLLRSLDIKNDLWSLLKRMMWYRVSCHLFSCRAFNIVHWFTIKLYGGVMAPKILYDLIICQNKLCVFLFRNILIYQKPQHFPWHLHYWIKQWLSFLADKWTSWKRIIGVRWSSQFRCGFHLHRHTFRSGP